MSNDRLRFPWDRPDARKPADADQRENLLIRYGVTFNEENGLYELPRNRYLTSKPYISEEAVMFVSLRELEKYLAHATYTPERGEFNALLNKVRKQNEE